MLSFMPETENYLRPRITVFGVGGAGGNAIRNMIEGGLQGVEFVIANTDAQALAGNPAERKLQLGLNVTRGLGAGSRPDIGRAAAEEVLTELQNYLEGAHMVFIAAGMGGGTGTGAAPVIARVARELGILTVGVVTKPFQFEGPHRMRQAEAGIAELQQHVDTLIVIPNQNLFRIANDKTTFIQAFQMADAVLHSGVRGITDLMVVPGLINRDFADVRTVMAEMGKAMIGTGEATGDGRALKAAEAAIANPLLDDVSMKGARGILINVAGGPDVTLFEVDECVNRIRDEVDADANLIFGATYDPAMEGRLRVSVVATGIEAQAKAAPHEAPATQRTAPARQATGGATAVSSAPASSINFAQAVAAMTQPRPATTMAASVATAAPARTMPATNTLPPPMMTPPPAMTAPTTAIMPQPGMAEPAPEIRFTSRPTGDNFMPARPAATAARPEVTAAPPRIETAVPVASEEVQNPARRSLGLFERVTGLTTSKKTAPPPRAETSVAPTTPASPTVPAEGPDDLLDIPAFLRRQGNG